MKTAPSRPVVRRRSLSLLFALSLAASLPAGCAAPKPAGPVPAPPAAPVPAVEPAPAPTAGGKRGPVTGGLQGVLAGGTVGHHTDAQEKTAEEAARDYDHDPSKGALLVLESVRVNPASLAPGETVNVNLSYAVLPAPREGLMAVKEVREVRFGEALVANLSVDTVRGGGVWRSTLPVVLPPGAPQGNYRVVAIVETEGSRESKETFFKVAP